MKIIVFSCITTLYRSNCTLKQTKKSAVLFETKHNVSAQMLISDNARLTIEVDHPVLTIFYTDLTE